MNVVGHHHKGGQLKPVAFARVVKSDNEHFEQLIGQEQPAPLIAGKGQVMIMILYIIAMAHVEPASSNILKPGLTSNPGHPAHNLTYTLFFIRWILKSILTLGQIHPIL